MNTEAREALLTLATAVEAAAEACRTLADAIEAEPEQTATCGDTVPGYETTPCILPRNHGIRDHLDRDGVDW